MHPIRHHSVIADTWQNEQWIRILFSVSQNVKVFSLVQALLLPFPGRACGHLPPICRLGLAKPAHALVCLFVFLSQGRCLAFCSSGLFRPPMVTCLVSGTAIEARSALWKSSCATSPTSCYLQVQWNRLHLAV